MNTRRSHLLCTVTLVTSLILVACGSGQQRIAPANSDPTPTSDPCAPANVPAQVKAIHDLTREFDDTTYVARQTPREQLAEVILVLQQTRRDAEDLDAPACVNTLQESQLRYMNAVVTTLADFLGGASAEHVQVRIVSARDLRVIYDTELARLLGVTPAPTPTTPPTVDPSETPVVKSTATPQPTIETDAAAPSLTANVQVNVRSGPGAEFEAIGLLESGEIAVAISRSESGEWLQIEYPASPNGSAWVAAELVQVSVPLDQLPVVAP